ncbi:MAG: hypothetical protein NTZ05_17895, partial [Chloroflexi bacterium]|nr:hypothetical protein [Chloroflexota bacterium]
GLRRWAIGSAVVAVLFMGAVTAAYFALRGDAGAPTPVGQVTVQHVHSLFVSPSAAKAVYLGHHEGLMRSTDSGKTWTPVTLNAPNADIMGMVSHPSAPAIMVIAGHEILMKSSDGGATFERLQSNLPDQDTGKGLPDSTLGLALMPGSPDLLFAATEGQGVLSSADGGKSWANASGFVNGALPTRTVYSIVGDPRSGDSFNSGSGAAFTGALYIGTDAGLFKTTDGGQSWNRLPLNTDVTALALDPADTTSLYAANGKGEVFHSPDRGITWRPRP